MEVLSKVLQLWMQHFIEACMQTRAMFDAKEKQKRKALSRFEQFLFHLCEFALPTVIRKMWPHTI